LGLAAGAMVGGMLVGSGEKPGSNRVLPIALGVLGAILGYAFFGDSSLFDAAHPPSIKPFGTLVALGVYIGSVVATRHARERGLDTKKMNEFIYWVVGLGFVGGHVLDAIFYHPDHVAKNPAYLFMLWEGLSSYGGFIGAIIGAIAYRYTKKEKILPYCESVCSAFPLAWVFGRAGCAMVHDHPGRLSDAWFAVRYPMGDSFVGRFDLGLYEFLLTIPLAITYLILWRRGPRRGDGFFVGLMCVAYAPVRFFLDFLREVEKNGVGMSGADPRYGGLTPAQWACFGLFALGIYFIRLSMRTPVSDQPGPSEPVPSARVAAGEPDSETGAHTPSARRRKRTKSKTRPSEAS
jgi:phosphatidylglycerol:prolipoprotein diacylglycerol transferase